MCEKITIPIYDFTILDQIYTDPEDLIYFPGINRPVQKKILCQSFIPKNNENELLSMSNMKSRVIQLLKSLNLSDYIKINQSKTSMNQFKKEVVQTKIKHGTVSGFKIHKLNNKQLVDKKLQETLEKMYSVYGGFVVDTYNELTSNFNDKFSKQLLKKHYVYAETEDNKLNLDDINIKECVYLIEFEIKREDSSVLGDKFTNRLVTLACKSCKLLEYLFKTISSHNRGSTTIRKEYTHLSGITRQLEIVEDIV